MQIRSKPNFKLVVDNVDIPLYVVETFELSGGNSIIINESATGNSGVSYNMGRLQEEVPVNGTLIGEDKDDVMSKIDTLFKVKDDGSLVQFVTPYGKKIRTNQYYIKQLNFSFGAGRDDTVGFSMVLTENRESNVKISQVNLVNYDYAEFLKDYYTTTTGQSL